MGDGVSRADGPRRTDSARRRARVRRGGRPSRQRPSDVDRLASFLLFAAGAAGLLWLCLEGWRSDAIAAAGVWVCLGFAAVVLAFRIVAWLGGPAYDWDSGESLGDLMTTSRWLSLQFSWLRTSITVRLGERERTTTLLGTTPIETSLTWLGIAACLAAWVLAGRLGWVWVPTSLPNHNEARRRLREWIFGF